MIRHSGKERSSVKYSKPEVKCLGNAEELIQKINNVKLHTQVEGLPGQRNAPAYDLDE